MQSRSGFENFNNSISDFKNVPKNIFYLNPKHFIDFENSTMGTNTTFNSMSKTYLKEVLGTRLNLSGPNGNQLRVSKTLITLVSIE